MFQGIMNGAGLIREAIRALEKYPRMLIPLLLCWLVYAPLLVAFKFHIPWDNFDILSQSLIVFLAILLLSVIFSWSAFMLLELIRQIETDEKFSISKAIGVSCINLVVALPIVIGWAVIWFSLTLIETILRRRSGSSDKEYNAKNVAKTVAGFQEFSLSGAFVEAVKKGVRMAAFLIYPAIAWERLGTASSVKKGLGIARSHKSEFAAGFVLTELAATIVFLPPALLFIVSDKFDISFSDPVWFGVMVYCAFAWSFSLFLEQMFVAELYLWHLIWEKEVDEAKNEGRPEPKLEDVKRPSVMDSVADLYLTNVRKSANKRL